MTENSNNFGVELHQIRWVSTWLSAHKNVVGVERSNDIQFDIEREHGRAIQMVCLNEYTCGITRILEAQEAFPGLSLIYVGGSWNSYTIDAKEYCLAANIGLFNTSEMTGAFYRDDFWTYHKKDKNGNPVYPGTLS